jgi:hypothetical protein
MYKILLAFASFEDIIRGVRKLIGDKREISVRVSTRARCQESEIKEHFEFLFTYVRS